MTDHASRQHIRIDTVVKKQPESAAPSRPTKSPPPRLAEISRLPLASGSGIRLIQREDLAVDDFIQKSQHFKALERASEQAASRILSKIDQGD